MHKIEKIIGNSKELLEYYHTHQDEIDSVISKMGIEDENEIKEIIEIHKVIDSMELIEFDKESGK